MPHGRQHRAAPIGKTAGMTVTPSHSTAGLGVSLVLGGARSGKTRFALTQAEATGLKPVYVATAQAFDEEMTDRIRRHQLERGPEWRTVEAPFELAAAIEAASSPQHVVLVDCLTLWLSNVMLAEREVATASAGLVAVLRRVGGPVILVSNEVGLGIVPDNALARRFRDQQGWLNQGIAAVADRVTFVAAGLPLVLKG